MKKFLLALGLVTTALVVGLAVVPASATADATHWYVCKYVGPPGSGEVLQGGGNPLFVDENAIDVDPVVVGATFSDAQSHSLVLAGPYSPPGVDPEPVCPGTPPPPPPPECPNGTTTVTVTHTIGAAVPAASCTVTVTVTVSQPPPVTTTPPPVVVNPPPTCKGSVALGPWYGDPRINITLVGSGHFVVSGGVQRFTGLKTITKTLTCNEVFKIGRYKVKQGHYLSITMNGVLITHIKPPRVH